MFNIHLSFEIAALCLPCVFLLEHLIYISFIFGFQVIQLKSNGVAFRFVPDSSQVANAIKVIIF